MTDAIVVYVTVSSTDEGDRLARALVEERLAACVNRVGSMQSIYRWQGMVEESEEQLLIIKSLKTSFEALAKRVRELHSYSEPEIIALPILEGSESYLKWLRDQVTDAA